MNMNQYNTPTHTNTTWPTLTHTDPHWHTLTHTDPLAAPRHTATPWWTRAQRRDEGPRRSARTRTHNTERRRHGKIPHVGMTGSRDDEDDRAILHKQSDMVGGRGGGVIPTWVSKRDAGDGAQIDALSIRCPMQLWVWKEREGRKGHWAVAEDNAHTHTHTDTQTHTHTWTHTYSVTRTSLTVVISQDV